MKQKPKLETVANEAGVSVATVSQVMRGTGRISDKTRRKVLAAAERLHYVPDGRAASMRSGEKREIGMIIHRIANPFNAEVISGVSDLLETQGYLVSVLDSQDEPERQRRNIEAFIRSSRGGLLWVPAQDTPDETIDLVSTHAIPTVTFLRSLAEDKFDHVGIHDRDATYQAAMHLAELGHRNIAFFGGEAETEVRRERIKGYEQVLAERGLCAPLVWNAPDDKVSGMNAMLALRKAHPEITGIVCNGDVVALGACHALRRIGQMPGREVSVVGFDDIQDASVATPPLTTMAVSPYEMGKLLAQKLLGRLANPTAPVSSTLLSAELVERATTSFVRDTELSGA